MRILHVCVSCCVVFFFFKQKTAYEMRISDWSSDVCSSDLAEQIGHDAEGRERDDVDLGMTEEPEQVLEQNRAAAVIAELLPHLDDRRQIGRASCRERVCQYV